MIIISALGILEVNAQKYPYTLQADINLLVGQSLPPVPGVHIFNGVKAEKWNAEAGLTVGADVYRQLALLPVSANVKWMPLEQRALMPYLSLSAGYGFAWLNRGTEEKDYQGGGVFNPLIGLRIKTRAKTRLNLGVGYKHQKANIVFTDLDDLGRTNSKVAEEYTFGRVSFNLGVGL